MCVYLPLESAHSFDWIVVKSFQRCAASSAVPSRSYRPKAPLVRGVRVNSCPGLHILPRIGAAWHIADHWLVYFVCWTGWTGWPVYIASTTHDTYSPEAKPRGCSCGCSCGWRSRPGQILICLTPNQVCVLVACECNAPFVVSLGRWCIEPRIIPAARGIALMGR